MRGFGLLEIMLVITITAFLATFGLPISYNVVASYVIESDRDVFLSLLSQARDQALHNFNQTNHGVAITNTTYVLYQGATYDTRDTSRDVNYPHSSSVVATGVTDYNFEAMSGRLSNNVSANTILDNRKKTFTVTVNKEGTIDW